MFGGQPNHYNIPTPVSVQLCSTPMPVPPDVWKVIELRNRVQQWRLQVAGSLSNPGYHQLHYSHSVSNHGRSTHSRRRSDKSTKPYERSRSQQIDNSQLLCISHPLPELPPRLEEDFSRRCRTPSVVQDQGHLSLPHPHHNQLIPESPDDLEEEYCRLFTTFTRFTAELQHAEYQAYCYGSEQRASLIDQLKADLLEIRKAMEYCQAYSKNKRWAIDFETLIHRRNHGITKPTPSQMRSLQCQSIFMEEPMPVPVWDSYPAA